MTTERLSLHRKLDAAERFFWLLDRVSCMNFVVFADVCGRLDTGRLQTALQQAQLTHPLLRVKIKAIPAGELWFAPAADIIPLHQSSVDQANWQQPIEAELSHPFSLDQAPLMRCHYLEFSDQKRSILALTFHHAIADGRSGCSLLREVLQQALHPEPGPYPDTGKVHPPMHAVFPQQFQWSRQPQAALALHETRKAEFRRHGKPGALPWLNSGAPSRVPCFVQIQLDAEQTVTLARRCKQHETTMHGAIGAAQLLAIYHTLGQPQAHTLSLGSPADMRPYLATETSADSLGLFVTLLHASYPMHEHADFWELARRVSSDIRRQLNRGDGHLLFSHIQPELFAPSDEGVAAFANIMLASPPSSMISNIGKVAAIAAPLHVASISFALCPMPYQIVFSAVSTYHDRLIINMNYDAAKLEEKQAQQLAQWLRQALITQQRI